MTIRDRAIENEKCFFIIKAVDDKGWKKEESINERKKNTIKDLLALITYLAEEDKAEKILENQKVIKTPIVRNGKQATVGYQPDIWKNWK